MATTNIAKVLDSVEEAIRELEGAPRVYQGRKWPSSWEAPFSALLSLSGVEAVDGHGGVERRQYTVLIRLRNRRRDHTNGDAQVDLAVEAARIRDALHLKDASDFNDPPVCHVKILVDSPFVVADDPDTDYMETAIELVWEVFETV